MTDPLNPLFAVVCLIVVLCALRLLGGRGPEASASRYNAVDGLRGYLAFFVFLHHSSIWYFYVKTAIWRLPPSHLFAHFGQSSVLLFFMITSLLFFSKLVDSRKVPVDWFRLYVSRVLRLSPVYCLALLLLCTFVAIETHFTLLEPKLDLAKNLLYWVGFACFGRPALNGFVPTWLIMGVTWTLRYEWLFYFSLPLIGSIVAPLRYVTLGTVALAILFCYSDPFEKVPLFAFGAGIIAALCADKAIVRRVARSRWGALFVIAPLVFAVVHFPNAFAIGLPFPSHEEFYLLGLLTIAFIAIASGNTIFGILSHPLSLALGELSYGIYLLQTFVLYVAFRWIVGYDRAAALGVVPFWCIVTACGVFLIGVSLLAFRYVERPAMKSVNRVTQFLRVRVLRQMS